MSDERQLKNHHFEAGLQQGIDDADHGRVMEAKDAFARLRRELAEVKLAHSTLLQPLLPACGEKVADRPDEGQPQ